MLTTSTLRRWLRALPTRRRASAPPHGGAAGHLPPQRQPGRAREYRGSVELAYSPRHDGEPDPGEVVWTWVPFEEDNGEGKDRPVVVIGRATSASPGDLAVLMLSSKPHPDDPRWLELGTGDWDPEGRASSVRLDRVLVVARDAVRREGAALERERFDRVGAALTNLHGW